MARASELGVLGWVRHGDEGDVLVHAEGDNDAVEDLLAFLAEGPEAAEVLDVEVEEVKPEGHEKFAIRGVSAGIFVVQGAPGDEPPLLRAARQAAPRWFSLQRTRGGDKPQWLLIKRADEEARRA